MSDAEQDKSCRTCPSRMTAEEAGAFFGKAIGAPMCARYGHVLGLPGFKPVQDEIVERDFGKNCDAHGWERPQDPPSVVQAQIAIADPSVFTGFAPSATDQAKVNSCLNCTNMIDSKTVMQELGVPANLCAAKGKLILHNRYGIEAKGCTFRSYGRTRRDMTGMNLMPIYVTARSFDPSPIAAFLARQGQPIIDPSEYAGDMPVEEWGELFQMPTDGVRAIRKIYDPEGSGEWIAIPIFHTDFFEPSEQQKIPHTGDDEHPEWYADVDGLVYRVALEWMGYDETPMLWGPAGVGKTELARHLAWLMNCPFDRISITNSTQVEDLIGKTEYSPDKGTWFREGRLVLRWRKPGVLLLDEPNLGPDDVWERVRPLTDNSKQLVLDEADAARISRNAFCFFIMAGNPAWDVRNIGAKEISDADGSRLVHVQMHMPPNEIVMAVLKKWCMEEPVPFMRWEPTKAQLTTLMKISDELRAMAEDGSLPITWGMRHNIKVVRHLKRLGWVRAFRSALDDKEPEVITMVLDRVRANTADEEVF